MLFDSAITQILSHHGCWLQDRQLNFPPCIPYESFTIHCYHDHSTETIICFSCSAPSQTAASIDNAMVGLFLIFRSRRKFPVVGDKVSNSLAPRYEHPQIDETNNRTGRRLRGVCIIIKNRRDNRSRNRFWQISLLFVASEG